MNEEKPDLHQLADSIRSWARELGFADAGISDTDLSADEPYLQQYLAAGHHGTMEYMARHGNLRSRPQELVPGTLRVISLRMEYLPQDVPLREALHNREQAYRTQPHRGCHQGLTTHSQESHRRYKPRCSTG